MKKIYKRMLTVLIGIIAIVLLVVIVNKTHYEYTMRKYKEAGQQQYEIVKEYFYENESLLKGICDELLKIDEFEYGNYTIQFEEDGGGGNYFTESDIICYLNGEFHSWNDEIEENLNNNTVLKEYFDECIKSEKLSYIVIDNGYYSTITFQPNPELIPLVLPNFSPSNEVIYCENSGYTQRSIEENWYIRIGGVLE
ncbi:MAG: hypothetical protein J6A59_13945 [Lachnospiraceae bacterium]|nr:hypothetical protein [Lachnospiraceae bacterium]